MQPSKILHRQKFDQGRRTPQEYHAEYAFPPTARCLCGRRPVTRALVLAPFDEAQKRGMLPEGAMFNPELMKLVVEVNEGTAAKPRGKAYLRISMTYACKSCTPTMEKALAKAPSWCVVELNHGPDSTNRIVTGAG